MRGFVYVRKGKRGRLKLAAIRPNIKEALKLADSYISFLSSERRNEVNPFISIQVKDENNITYQSTLLGDY